MNILIAEDDKVCRELLEVMLDEWGYELVTCADGIEAWQILEQNDSPRLAILDWRMPGMDGLEVCRKIRQSQKSSFTYILMLTGKANQEDVVEAIEAGADDYLSKPFNKDELRVRLRAGQRIVELQEALQFQATHDSLTGVWNHKSIVEILQREMVRAERECTPLGVLMVDLDHFKQINDVYGHLIGHEVLQQTVQRLIVAILPYDQSGRYGGDEFLIVLPMLTSALPDLVNVAERVRSAVADAPLKTSREEIRVTVSLGAVWAETGKTGNIRPLIHRVDQCLYRAKENGRNCVEVDVIKEQEPSVETSP